MRTLPRHTGNPHPTPDRLPDAGGGRRLRKRRRGRGGRRGGATVGPGAHTPKHIGPACGQGQALVRKSQDFTQTGRNVHRPFRAIRLIAPFPGRFVGAGGGPSATSAGPFCGATPRESSAFAVQDPAWRGVGAARIVGPCQRDLALHSGLRRHAGRAGTVSLAPRAGPRQRTDAFRRRTRALTPQLGGPVACVLRPSSGPPTVRSRCATPYTNPDRTITASK